MASEQLIIQIRADGTRQVQRQLTGIGSTARRQEAGVNLLRRALLFVGVAAAIRSVVGTLAKFTQSLSTLQAVTGATDDQLTKLRATAEDLGATTRFSATQAADGLVFLARAGFTVNESLEAIEGTLKLAQAGELELARAADIASNVLTGFNLAASETARVVDVLALAANSSNTNVEQLGFAMKKVAPVAASMGISIEEASAAVSVLSNAGIQGESAGAGLVQVMSKLISPTQAARKVFRDLGLSLDEINPETVGLGKALETLAARGISTAQAFKAFGIRGGPAFAVLKAGVKDVSDLTAEYLKAEGTVDRVAEIMDDNLTGALLRVKSAIEAVELAFGNLGGESALTNFFNGLASAIRFVALNTEVLEGVLISLGLVVLPKVLTGIRAITAAIAANPLGALSVALAAAIGFLIAFRDEIIVGADGVTTLGDVSKAAFEVIAEGFAILREAGAEALTIIVQTWNGIFGDDLPGTFEGFVTVVAKGIDAVIGVFSGVGAVIVSAFNDPINTVGFLFIELVNFIIRSLNTLTRRLSVELRFMQDSLIILLSNIPGIAQSVLDEVAQLRVTLPQLDELEQSFSNAGQTLGEAFSIGFEKSTQAQDLTAGIFERAGQIGAERIAAGEGGAGPTEDELARQQRLNALINGQTAATVANAEAAKESSSAIEDNRTALEGLQEGFKNAEMSAGQFGEALSGIVVGAVQSLSNAIADAVVNGIQDFDDFKQALSDIFKNIAKQIIALIIQFLILKAISAIAGDGGGAGQTVSGLAGGNTGIPLRAAGGPVRRNEPTIVGERGPELFTPSGNGNITPNSQMGGGQPAQVTVVNVTDPNEVANVLSTVEGEQAVLNVISKNSRQVGQIVQGGN